MTGGAGPAVVQVVGLTKAYHFWGSPQAKLLAPVLRQVSRMPGVPPRLAERLGRRADEMAPPFRALRGVSLEVRHNETLGIVGRNGSGKSTLLQIIAGILSPTQGAVRVDGRVAALLELGAGFHPDFTGRENVKLNATILGLTERQVAERFDAIAAFAEIGEFMDRPVRTFSSGMYLRLAFSVAVHADADVLIIDEALAVGDEAFQRKCFARIARFREQGGTILFVSHSASAVVELCDRAVLLEQGELLMTGAPKAVVGAYQRLLSAERAGDAEALRREMAEASAAPPEAEEGGAPRAADGDFDPSLVPSSTLAYESRGAEIRDARLVTRDGRQVNVLEAREEYVYEYEVAFTEECYAVRFGMMTRSVSGYEIGGAVSSLPEDAIPRVGAGASVRVRFRFRCDLVPSAYFLNAGVVGRRGGEGDEVFLHRVVDLVMFRVNPMPRNLMTGIFDLRIEPEVTVLS